MKCKICGHRTSGEKALPNMMKHYRKDHPAKLKERKAPKPNLKKGITFGQEIVQIYLSMDQMNILIKNGMTVATSPGVVYQITSMMGSSNR